MVTGAVVNECGELAPHLARWWSGSDEELRLAYEQEWLQVVEDAPGKLTKLFHALLFFGGALRVAARRRSALRSGWWSGVGWLARGGRALLGGPAVYYGCCVLVNSVVFAVVMAGYGDVTCLSRCLSSG
ncbi:hypothetical protein SAMN05421748_107131 [Paractinoplanes atraurantiacus]|uniref:Uncharacterized protein n=1 Tax=Paractinoplanes atraurantiacus TaxID=1036182 RepID=A0A285IA90_9ACTN|nr:hypothetical protein SAMN05421748_107131 [Actinoplanes atraurantiacus]